MIQHRRNQTQMINRDSLMKSSSSSSLLWRTPKADSYQFRQKQHEINS